MVVYRCDSCQWSTNESRELYRFALIHQKRDIADDSTNYQGDFASFKGYTEEIARQGLTFDICRQCAMDLGILLKVSNPKDEPPLVTNDTLDVPRRQNCRWRFVKWYRTFRGVTVEESAHT
jgi:hypothetical protein